MEGSCLSLPGTAGDSRAFCGEQTSACGYWIQRRLCVWLGLKNRVVNGRFSTSSLWTGVYGQQPGLRPLLSRLSLLLTGYSGQIIQASLVFGNLFYKDFGSSTVCGDGSTRVNCSERASL